MGIFVPDEMIVHSEAGIGITSGADSVLMNPALQKLAGLETRPDLARMTFAELEDTPGGNDLAIILRGLRTSDPDRTKNLLREVRLGSDTYSMLDLQTYMSDSPHHLLIFFSSTGVSSTSKTSSIPAADLYRIVHDLKAPVRAIRNLTGWIAEECSSLESSNDLKEYLDLLSSSSVDLNDRIESILRRTRD